jgi:hypothetical protein
MPIIIEIASSFSTTMEIVGVEWITEALSLQDLLLDHMVIL